MLILTALSSCSISEAIWTMGPRTAYSTLCIFGFRVRSVRSFPLIVLVTDKCRVRLMGLNDTYFCWLLPLTAVPLPKRRQADLDFRIREVFLEDDNIVWDRPLIRTSLIGSSEAKSAGRLRGKKIKLVDLHFDNKTNSGSILF